MFSTETPYELIRGRNIEPSVSSCTPSKFWLVGRHGARFPNSNEIRIINENSEALHSNILSNYNAGRTSLCASDIALIRDWRFDPNITSENAQFLTVAGWNEVQGIAQRYQTALPTLLPSTYSLTHYSFRSAALPGMISSIAAFADGLFGLNGHQQVEFDNIDNPDLLLSPHENCPIFDEINSISTESDAFEEGPEYQEMSTQISSKLGFHGSHTLSAEQILALIYICEFEQIYDLNSTSPLCAAFSVANFQVLEYRQDLFRYYLYGYGQFPNYRRLYENINCHLIQDMLHYLRSNDSSDPRARIFNAENIPMMFILNVLGVYEDPVPLTRHNLAQQTFRLWRSSHLSPKAANLAVVRYDCPDGDSDVLFLHNEKPLSIDGCQSNGVCKLSMILERFSRYLDVNCAEIFCTNS
ncbi:multiple inositol polyphosphate phosphatase 1-like [Bradysia coprophila]|uniref:multiple inositol polyphosphate phosphatase 1-like n=1 Tax=Bradysia coprophila TaxID=38358 RepID=UPI00187DBC1C|nr:multiple inositol polyphosphate phosphatase 1-like [Bradysia coprophila]